jgi:hypothetical protein
VTLRQPRWRAWPHGASFIIRNHSYRETDWGEFNKLVEDLMASYDAPAGKTASGKVAAE